jgi:F0F1-type ATP synthase gamma subunit
MSLEQTQQHKQTVIAIHDTVGAMRAIAAGRLRGAQRALGNARRCQAVVLQALAALSPEAKSLPPARVEDGHTLLTQAELFHCLAPLELVVGLIREYIFINLYRLLYRLAAESFTSRPASRLMAMDGAMDGATRGTEKMLQSLAELERRQRQEKITRQARDLIAARFAAS